MRRSWWFFFCLGLAMAAWSRVEAQPETGAEAAKTNLFAMTVKVVDAAESKPLAGVAVVVTSLMPGTGTEAGTNEWRFLTDERGTTRLTVPAALVGSNYFGLIASNANYPARMAAWYSQSGSLRGALPGEYTFRLERGVSIGGFVQDEGGRPLPGVKVSPWGNSRAAYGYGSGEGAVQEYSTVERDDRRAVTTDARGFWVVTNFPADVDLVWIDVTRAGGSRSVFSTAEQSGAMYGEPAEPVDMAGLRATNVVLKLRKGAKIRGVVVNESGQPVAGARLRERVGGGWNSPTHRFTNDADGRFELPDRLALQSLITAEVDGYATGSAIVTPAADAPEVRLVLERALPRRMRVVTEEDAPVSGARLGLVDYRNRGHLLEWSATTDAEGRATWTNAPKQALTVSVAATNYPQRMARLKVDDGEQTIRLRRSNDAAIAVRLKVTDGESGRALERFDVWRDVQWGNAMKNVGWSGTNGGFSGRLTLSDFQQGTAGAFRLQVRAEGYTPWSSGEVYFDEGDYEMSVALRKAPPPAGLVLQPDGQPAAQARLMLNSSAQGSIFANAPDRYNANDGVVTATSGADGSFRFDGGEDEQRLIVTHPGGFAALTLGELRRTGKAQLQAWAALEGVLRAAGEPVTQRQVFIKSPVSWEAAEGMNLLFSATTDAAGKFLFTNLPPGDFLLYRVPQSIMYVGHTESHRLLVSLQPGEKKQLEYSLGGRPVVGRVDSGAEVNWQNDAHVLTLKMPPPPPAPNYYAYADPKDFEKARRAYGKSAAFREYERQRQQFQLVFDRDGNFKIDDVPPGNYELAIRVTKPPANPRMGRFPGNEQVLGTLKREVTIPAGKPGEEFDLGAFEMEINDAPGPRLPPLDFTAETLDGKPFNALTLRGRPAAVLFWAKWAPHSPARVAELRAAFDALGAGRGAAFVTVNLDENPEAVREGVKNLADGWIHTRLNGPAVVEVTERLGVDTLPALLLLDDEGRVAIRDAGGKRLRSALERLIKQTTKK